MINRMWSNNSFDILSKTYFVAEISNKVSPKPENLFLSAVQRSCAPRQFWYIALLRWKQGLNPIGYKSVNPDVRNKLK